MTDSKYLDTHILDLREELEELVPHFQWYGLRQVDYSRPCGCKEESPDGIPGSGSCKRCFRTGYLFTDYIVKGYMWSATLGFAFDTKVGKISTQRSNFVLKHDRSVNKFDYIITLDTHPDTGVIRQPIAIIRAYEVQDSLPLYGKDGRIEFFKCSLEERNLDGGRNNSQGSGVPYKGTKSNDPTW